MKKIGLRSVLKRIFVVTTDSNHNLSNCKNILNRDFTSNQSRQKWVYDITWYDTKRLYSSLGYKIPLQRELELIVLFKIAT